MACRHTTPPGRAAFTLIELIVVMAILTVLATLTLALVPSLLGHARAAQGAGQVQGWLLIARQQARRDQAPTGLRLAVDPQGYVRSVQFVQQPAALQGPGACQGGTGANPVLFDPPTNFGGAGDPDQNIVQAGDYLELNGGGPVHQVATVRGPAALDLTVPATFPATQTWRVLRQPRPLVGELPLLLAQDVAIDLNAGRSQGVPVRTVPPAAGSGLPAVDFREILFSPSGAVVGKGTAGDRIFLWVRDVTLVDPYDGEPTILAIQVRTGFISAHAVNPTGDPYLFAEDDRSSGM